MNLYDKITRFYRECPREWNYYNETLGNPFDDSQVNDFIRQHNKLRTGL